MDDSADRIRRLAEALSLVSAALQELSTALEASEAAYREAGRPFGHSPSARLLWRLFGQQTTVN